MEIKLKLFRRSMLVDMNNPEQVINTANGLINDLELYNQKEVANYSDKYACTREALNKLFESMVKPK